MFQIIYNMTSHNTSPWSDTLLLLTVCGKGWMMIYLSWVLLNSLLTSLALHLMAIGLLICVVAALKLPTPDKDLVRAVLGEELHTEEQESPGHQDSRRKYGINLKLKILLLQPGQLPTELLVWMLLRTVLRQSDLPPRMGQSGLSLM